MNIHINPNCKEYFKSLNAINKFKECIKKNNDSNLVDLSEKYVKEGYGAKIEQRTNQDIRFTVVKLQTVDEVLKQENLKRQHEVLKYQLKARGLARSNKPVPTSSKDGNLELYSEYIKLAKVVNFPVPSPNEVTSNPSKYVKSINMMLNMLKSNPSHPAFTYFTLLSKKLEQFRGLDEPVPQLVDDDMPNLVQDEIKDLNKLLQDASTSVESIKGNKIETNDTDTESEVESE
jgi:hypothetical protein